MSAETIAKGNFYAFKKGNRPHNQKDADGVITIRTYRGYPYQFIRVSLGKWLFHHRVIWEQHNGPIPKATNVIFKDGNTLNCCIENLELLSNADLMKRNSIHNLPEPVKEVIYLNQSLNNQIKRTLKNLKDAK